MFIGKKILVAFATIATIVSSNTQGAGKILNLEKNGKANAAMLIVKKIDWKNKGVDNVLVENNYLKMVVSATGGKILSLYDKTRNYENAKVFYPNEGINVLRLKGFNRAGAKKLMTGKYTLSIDKNSKRVTVSASITLDNYLNGISVGPITFIRKYTMRKMSTSIKTEFVVLNNSRKKLSVLPWIHHLLYSGLDELASVSFMTANGVYYSKHLIPGRNGNKFNITNLHFFPASNWMSRTIMPVVDHSNTLSTITKPEDMFKVYSWRKKGEEFMTQEPIFLPMSIAPGKQASIEYYITITAPLAYTVYSSPKLNIGATPHPTGISTDASELKLSFSSTEPILTLDAKGKILNLKTKKIISTFQFKLKNLTPEVLRYAVVPLKLESKTNYQLILSLTENGKVFNSGISSSGKPNIIIPIVVGTEDTPDIVFADETNRDNAFKKIEAKTFSLPLLLQQGTLSIYKYPTYKHCFKNYKFKSAGKGELSIKAAANEYESIQLALTANGKSLKNCSIKIRPFSGEKNRVPICEGAKRFLYAKTTVPSSYNPEFAIGEYPDALITAGIFDIKQGETFPIFITFYVPKNTPPGKYETSLEINVGGKSYSIPLKVNVWNFKLPVTPKLEISCDIKAIGKPDIRNKKGRRLSENEILEDLFDMHLKYKMTPTNLVNTLLLAEKYDEFDRKMEQYVKKGVSKMLLGMAPDLLKRYGKARLQRIEKHLKEHNWQKLFYVRFGMDELSLDRANKLRDKCLEWKKISSIPTMETWYHKEETPALYGALDIYSRHTADEEWVKKRKKAGDKFWNVNAMPAILEEEPWMEGRALYWKLFDENFTGTYLWTVKNWVWVMDWGNNWWADVGAGNLVAVLIWHHPTGLLPTIRLESLRDGVEDNTMLQMLQEKLDKAEEKGQHSPVINEVKAFFAKGMFQQRIKSAAELDKLHEQAGDLLSKLNNL